MKMRRLTLLSVATIFSLMFCMGGDYKPIGSGGPSGDNGKYSIVPEVPDHSRCDEVYQAGHGFEFKGQLILDEPAELDKWDEWDEYTFWFAKPARILVQNFSDVRCERDRRDPPTCYIEKGAYLVTNGGDLIFIKDVKIRPDNDMSVPAWQYLGIGYLTKASSESEIVSSPSSSGPNSVTADARNLTDSITNLSERASELNQGINDALSDLNDLNAEMNAPNATIDANLIEKADNLSKSLEDLRGIAEGLISDLEQSKSKSEALTERVEGLETDLTTMATDLTRCINETTPKCQYKQLKWSGPEIDCKGTKS